MPEMRYPGGTVRFRRTDLLVHGHTIAGLVVVVFLLVAVVQAMPRALTLLERETGPLAEAG